MNGTPSMIAHLLERHSELNLWISRFAAEQRAPIRFTFFWTSKGSWEGRDYMVEVES